jgi:hypothetical protein
MYNVLEKLKQSGLRRDDEGKEGVTLTTREEDIKSRALVLILKEYHEELDHAVARAYGWPTALSDEEILARLVVLNRERAAEESRGLVRWLRPDYQIPRFGSTQDKLRLEGGEAREPAAPAPDKAKPSFPQGAVDQTAAVMAALAAAPAPLAPGELAQFFRQGRRSEARIAATLASLARTGFIAALDNGARFALRRSA